MSTFKPLSQYNAFFKLARERTLCGLDQLVGLHIQNKFNQAHWTDKILIADAELLECINWYDKTGSPTSINSIRIAKARLKKKGFIDFKSGKGNKQTEYRLIQLYPSDTPSDTPPDTPSETPSDTGLVCYTARAPKRFLDVKTDCSVGLLSARERETKKEEETLSNRDPQASEDEPIDQLVDYWERTLRGGRMNAEHQSELLIYLNDPTKGFAWVKEAMKEASDANGNPHGLSFKLLRGVMEKKTKPKQQTRQPVLKGGEKDGRKQESDGYEIPVDTGDEPWNKY